MDLFFQRVFSLLTSETGSLAYHLVLAFSVTGALVTALIAWNTSRQPGHRRAAIGLSVLLVIQLGLFLVAGLAWQGAVDAQSFLPLADRLLALLSVLVIVWLWAFPEPSRSADAGTVLLGLTAITLSVLSVVYWSMLVSQSPVFSGSLPDVGASVFALILLGLGVLLLAIRRPNGWGVGMAMFLLVMAGYLVNFLLPAVGNYSGAVRLGFMAAFPLLLFLPQRLAPSEPSQPADISLRETTQATGALPDVAAISALLKLVGEPENDENCRAVSRLLCAIFPADISLILETPDEAGETSIHCGYDRLYDRFIERTNLDDHLAPELASTLRTHLSIQLDSSQVTSDQLGLARALKLSRTGDLIAATITPENAASGLAIVLLNPFSGLEFSREDLQCLDDLAGALVHLLHPNHSPALLEQEISRLRQERQQLLAQVASLQQSAEQDQRQLASLAVLISNQEAVQDQLTEMVTESQQLAGTATRNQDDAGARAQLEGDLRIALQEIALLRAELAGKPGAAELEEPVETGTPAAQQVEMVASLAQEIRQPLSSIIGYTDFLLSESIGILGVLQRKFLERMRGSSERMSTLVEQLIDASAGSARDGRVEPVAVDCSAILRAAASAASPGFEEKHVRLALDVPEDLTGSINDQEALEQITIHLLENAISATPSGGEVALAARIEPGDGRQTYLLVQVSDQGGGIAPRDLPRVFSRLYRSDKSTIPGLGDNGVGISVAKSLTESLGGRIWIDSQPEKGSTFSILLPLVSSPAGTGGSEEQSEV